METVCVIRRKKEWKESFELSQDYQSLWANKIWNETFQTSFIEFRRGLREIQDANLSKVGFDIICDVYEIKQYFMNPGYVLFPTDDDDWFHHDLLSIVLDKIYGYQFANWGHVRLKLNKLEVHRESVFWSNNYCCVSPTVKNAVRNHMMAGSTIKQTNYLFMDDILSFYNRSLASLSFLKKVYTPMQLVEQYEKCKLEIVRQPEVSPIFDPYIDQMIDLYKRLEPKCRIKQL